MLLCDLQYDEERLLIVCRLITSPAPSGLRRSLSWPNSTRKKRRWPGTSLSSRKLRRWVKSGRSGGGAKLLVTDLFAVLIGYHSTNWFVVVVDE